jgi:hypothetical protein
VTTTAAAHGARCTGGRASRARRRRRQGAHDVTARHSSSAARRLGCGGGKDAGRETRTGCGRGPGTGRGGTSGEQLASGQVRRPKQAYPAVPVFTHAPCSSASSRSRPAPIMLRSFDRSETSAQSPGHGQSSLARPRTLWPPPFRLHPTRPHTA